MVSYITLEKAQSKFIDAPSYRLEATVWRSDRRGLVGIFRAVKFGCIVIDMLEHGWAGIVSVPSIDSKFVITSANLMLWEGGFSISPTDRWGKGTVGAEILKRGFPFWVNVDYNRDSHMHFMMTEAEWESMCKWLQENGLTFDHR